MELKKTFGYWAILYIAILGVFGLGIGKIYVRPTEPAHLGLILFTLVNAIGAFRFSLFKRDSIYLFFATYFFAAIYPALSFYLLGAKLPSGHLLLPFARHVNLWLLLISTVGLTLAGAQLAYVFVKLAPLNGEPRISLRSILLVPVGTLAGVFVILKFSHASPYRPNPTLRPPEEYCLVDDHFIAQDACFRNAEATLREQLIKSLKAQPEAGNKIAEMEKSFAEKCNAEIRSLDMKANAIQMKKCFTGLQYKALQDLIRDQ